MNQPRPRPPIDRKVEGRPELPGVALVFGPLPTRRLGRSLGIDTVPLKTCNWNCAYCQLGRTRHFTTLRRAYVPMRQVLDQVERRLESLPQDAIDWITFVSSGEGTLHRDIGELVRAVKRLSRHPVAVITNGSLLHLEEVREELSAADAVLPTLDAGDEPTFRRLNRPHPRLTYEQHVGGLEAFARLRRRGRLCLEVMLVAGVNDSEDALARLATVIGRIVPEEVHITLPTRCPAAAWVRPPPEAVVLRAGALLHATVKDQSEAKPALLRSDAASLGDEILSVITRHPWRLDDLPRLFGRLPPAVVQQALDRLLAGRQAQLVNRHGACFLAAAPGCYRVPHPARNPAGNLPAGKGDGDGANAPPGRAPDSNPGPTGGGPG